MSNQEAITLLRNLEDSLDSYCELNEEGKTAFRMAIEALSCSEFPNSSDAINRQAAIDIERNATVDTNPSHFEAHQKFTQFMDDAEVSSFGRWQWSNGFNTALTAVRIDLKKLPSAQPEYIQNNAVHLCDSCQYTYATCPSHGNDAVFGDGKGNDNICACNKYRPISAQPEKETPKRVLWNGWKGMRDTRYKCPNCKKPVRNTDIYCHRCGQKLMFPNISFTPYVEGQKQELIVRWDDE